MTDIGKIKKALDKVSDDHNSGPGMLDGEWTRQIMEEVGKLYKRKEENFVYCTNGPDGGEYLYDLCCLEYEGDFLVRAPLILECEWGKLDDIYDDFQKLLLGRADLRVMIFSAKTETKMSEFVDYLRESLRVFNEGADDDNYLLSCWCIQTKSFHHIAIP